MNRREKIDFVVRKLKNNSKVAKKYGLTYAVANFLSTVVFRSKSKIGRWFNVYEHEKVKQYLRLNYGEVLRSYEYSEAQRIEDSAPIWILWWQGEENAPIIVKKCIESSRRKSGKHKVNIISKENYRNYIRIPDSIEKKLENGSITITHFSDILRMALLYEYGGIWMDATLFAIDEFTKDISKYTLYSIHHNKFTDYHVCKGKWATFFLASGKKNATIKLIRDLLYAYFEKEDYIITYLLFDCIIAICYEDIWQIKTEIDRIPINNTGVFELQNLLKNDFSELEYEQLKKNTNLFKVSWKQNFETSGENTYLKRVIFRI